MSKITETISKISKIVNLNQSCFPNEAFSTFSYTGNIKSQQDISKLKKILELIFKLCKERVLNELFISPQNIFNILSYAFIN